MPYVRNWAYLAGLIDGEGYVGLVKLIDKRRNNAVQYSPRMAISMTHKDTILYLHKTFGGIFENQAKKNFVNNCKAQYRWRAPSKQKEILNICEKLLPFLITKKKQAEELINYCKIRILAPHSYSKHFTYTKSEPKIYKNLRKLNRRGIR